MSKRVPCNECREHKRRCSGESPCERCQKFNVPCVYTVKTSPRDEEYLHEIGLRQEVEELQAQLKFMENEVQAMRLGAMQQYPSPPTDSSRSEFSSSQSVSSHSFSFSPMVETAFLDDGTTSSGGESTATSDDAPNDKQLTKRRRLIAQCEQGGYAAVTYADEKQGGWQLKVKNNRLCIQTHIRTHAELLDNLQKIVSTLEFESKIPLFFNQCTDEDPMSVILRTIMWKKYGKSRYKSMAKMILLIDHQPDTESKKPEFVVDEATITLQLLKSYLDCQNMWQISFHRHTFWKLYVENGNPNFSPAVMAICAYICVSPCRHIASLLPSDQLVDYGRYYFERAHDLLSDRFDEASLEVLIGYAYIGSYKLKVSQLDDTDRYYNMAERMLAILKQQYARADDFVGDPFYLGKAACISRLSQFVARGRVFSHLARADLAHNGDPQARKEGYHAMHNLVHGPERDLVPVEGDSYEEIRYIQAYLAMHQLRHEAHKVVERFHSNDMSTFIGTFIHQLEMVVRNWYMALPEDFRLPLPLFDETVPDAIFCEKARIASETSMIPFITTLRVYSEYLILSKSYIPKTHVEEGGVFGTAEFGARCRAAHYKDHHKQKVLALRPLLDFDGTDEDLLNLVQESFFKVTEELRVALITYATKASCITLRLLQFARTLKDSQVCISNMRTELDGFDVAMRCYRIKRAFGLDSKHTREQYGQILSGYLEIAREFMTWVPHNSILCEQVRSMETNFQKYFPELAARARPLTRNEEVDIASYLNI
ncbi:hypothetical protein BCR43DRAFT_486480 [Syncephalastrum racemosum]|uniref:Zn(2)-C6 fungal-type domain-containing protein n=1 Tax=Syncephalastrum racemosum TaxID=13706 RepID=A0A1X2HP86_SYNRA|nr:hypothetical protein BCR43DRAFT_486480 [Syncephalastrum racemosum]